MAESGSSVSSEVRTWRTSFLTLRDETLSSPPRTPLSQLLHNLIFSQSQSLLSAAPKLPPHEVTSDLLFLMEVAATSSNGAQQMAPSFSHLSRLIHDICHCVPLQLNSSSWTLLLDSFASLLELFIRTNSTVSDSSPNSVAFSPSLECLFTLRRIVSVYQRRCSSSDDIQLVKFLLRIIKSSHAELSCSSHFKRSNQRGFSDIGKKVPQSTSLWDFQTLAFTMLGETISRVGSSFPADLWKSMMEVFRKVMDVLASTSVLVEDNVMARFYAALLNCLHLVLKDPKGSLSDHVSGFVAALRMFLTYGITGRSHPSSSTNGFTEQALPLKSVKSHVEESRRTDRSPYRPPHLRKRDNSNQKPIAWGSQSLSDHESTALDYSSSDSEYSDSDGSIRDSDSIRKSKVRVAAIDCIQDLCKADPKSFTTQWMLLLPTSDVLQPRKFEATLMTCLLFDPYLKARIVSASTLAVMLEGPSPVFLQVAEYKESSKRGSFTALSSSLGHILMQLHTGIIHLIQRENHGRLLVYLFKILMLLISSTPYSRMPSELLPTVITSLHDKMEEGFPFKSDQTNLQTAAIGCLTVALTTSPSYPQVKDMLLKEMSTDFLEAQKKSDVLSTLFRYSEEVSNPTVCFEALQALRGVSHNYPSIMVSCWERVSTVVYGFLRVPNSCKGHVGYTVGFIGEKVITAAIKVLDECLRAISGFKGTEDVSDENLLDTPFTSDCIRMKKVSSAPSYEPEIPKDTRDEYISSQTGTLLWSEAMEKHMPLILQHTSSMVRAASVTCFAGITSSVFSSLLKEKQELILSSLIYAAEQDEVPSVRSASCRAIGVISCFPQVCQSAETLDKFIHAVGINTRDTSISVRITASWALANICDSIRHCIDTCASKGSTDYSPIPQLVAKLTDCALRLSNDGDKIKSNAVRALGNLSRFIKCSSLSEELPSTSDWNVSNRYGSSSYLRASFGGPRWFEKTVQTLISCVTTGNVKVQWNVCHALSNLFLNETLRLREMDWAPSVFSILLLLLRDSSNYKIRIQAAVALAVPSSLLDYGNSYSDVVQGLEHLVENLGSDQISAPSSFKYRVALEKQLTSTMLHVLSLASSTDHEPLKDFLIKKASFLEEWFKVLCMPFVATSSEAVAETSSSSIGNQKKEMISKAIRSLIELFEGRKQHALAQKFEKLENTMQ
ncbi:hypothetical protein UlMin_001380 [Ulmus minor]